MRFKVLILAALIALSSITMSYADKVIEVVDGDTMKVQIGDEVKTVRLLQIDTPESKHPNSCKNVKIGEDIAAFVKKTAENKSVSLSYDKEKKDKYGRVLAYVTIKGDKVALNEILVKRGYAKVVKYGKNTKNYETYKKIEKQVREKKIGIWEDIEKNYPKCSTNVNGPIRANIKSGVYHIPGQNNYDKLNPKNVKEFKTEEEAIKAGYRKAKR